MQGITQEFKKDDKKTGGWNMQWIRVVIQYEWRELSLM